MYQVAGIIEPGSAGALAALPVLFLFMFGGMFVLGIIIFKFFLWWRVFSKAGFSGAFCLLLLAPFGSLIMLCILAFSDWPIKHSVQQQGQSAAM